MTRDHVRQLLAYAAAGTRDWSPTSVDVDVWLDLLADLDYDDTLEALRNHARTTHHRPVPADLRAGVKRLRTDRLSRTPDAIPDADPDEPAAYQRALREGRLRIAEGLHPRNVPALVSGTFPSPPPADWRPKLPARTSTPPPVLSPVDDQRMAQARAEVAARPIIPVPEQDTESSAP